MNQIIKEAIVKLYGEVVHYGTSYEDEFKMFVYHIEKQYNLENMTTEEHGTFMIWLKGIFQYQSQTQKGRPRPYGNSRH